MNNLDMNKLFGILKNINKSDLEKAISQANQIMNSEQKDKIIEEFKKSMK